MFLTVEQKNISNRMVAESSAACKIYVVDETFAFFQHREVQHILHV
jgi:hypothetical protein